KYLGMGAYGEVWVAVERNTGRRVAIKFYTHRGGLDWSLLSREVEKLAFLFADRYVVQLLGVGWDAEPPYYIMEYLERGSLAARLDQGPLPVAEAVDLFRHLAIGLVHAHGKGVLHCDLKPANILLDQDGLPRLADFGQSRLSHDQTPALGTLFYMAPEQAHLTEAPNARWDVYALGAVLYCMLTGRPPHWSEEAVRELEATDDLKKRLGLYRRMIRKSPPLVVHRKIRGVDRQLAEILSRCLAPSPEERYPNVQAVLGALDARDKRRSRRPVMLLGAIGPVLLLLLVAWFAWQGIGLAVADTDRVLTARAIKTNEFLADNLARLAGYELDRRLQRVEILANSKPLREAMAKAVGPGSALVPTLERLSDPKLPAAERERLAREFREKNVQRAELQKVFAERVRRYPLPGTVGYFLNDARGVQIAREPEDAIIGQNFAWRTYFNGRVDDMRESERPGPDEHLTKPRISAVYRSKAIHRWMASIAAPVYDLSPEKKFLGVVAVMVPVGEFVQFAGQNESQFAALIDWRKGRNHGLVLQHPKLDKVVERSGMPEGESPVFVVKNLNVASGGSGQLVDYFDPVTDKPGSRKRWLAQMTPVPLGGEKARPDDCLMIVVQENHRGSIGRTLDGLKRRLVGFAVLGLAMIVVVMIGLWTLAIRMFREETGSQVTPAGERSPTGLPSGSATPSSASGDSTKQ
ncbi:MAG TPA: protein kinase, partial [Thermoguttaceae bacterium]|nr:protein kinase [Thermoguttaceae bacterium]